MSSHDNEKSRINSEDETSANSDKSWLLSRLGEELKDLSSIQLWRAVLAEFLGTMVLCLWTIGIGLRNEEDGPAEILTVAMGSGLCVAAVISMLLSVSGGHVNPAVSLGFLLGGKITFVRFVLFSSVQCMSSVPAVYIIQTVFPASMHGSLGYISPGPGATILQVFLGEFMVGYFLLFGISGFIDDARSDLEGLVPMYVGFIVVSNILFAAGISGGCMNPARNFGPAVMTGNTDLIWAYSIGPMAGSLFGSLTYNLLLSGNAILGTGCCRKSDSTSRTVSDAKRTEETEFMIQQNGD